MSFHRKRGAPGHVNARGLWSIPGVRVRQGGILTDRDYAAMDGLSQLVERTGTEDPPKFAQAALDVHMGTDAEQLIDEEGRRKPIVLQSGHLVIRPGQVLSVATQERFKLPADIQGQVSPKGALTTIGLFFPTTHVDPGYDDHLYLPIFNAGPNTARLPVGIAIGKVELERLPRPVAEPWRGRSSFRRSELADLVTPGENLDERLDRLRRRVVWLQVAIFLVALGVLSMLLAAPVAAQLENFDWKLLTSEAVKAFVAPVVAGLAVLGIVALLGAATQGRRATWARFRLQHIPLEEEETR